MKNFPGFKKSLAMMRDRDPQIQEEGFQLLRPRAGEFVDEFIAEYLQEEDHGLQCWFLELIGEAQRPESLDFLASQIHSTDERIRFWAMWGLKKLDTKESRTRLWEVRSRDSNHGI
ncbi:MAG: HEAT repeat domain-containing protein [Planctomycetaceae bacterium]